VRWGRRKVIWQGGVRETSRLPFEDEMKNGRDDRIDVEQINRNTRLVQDSNWESPQNEDIMSGEADYGERLFDQLPEDKVGFMSNGHKRR
jgi:hypothetical protein